VAQHVVHVEDDKPLRQILDLALRAVEPSIDLHQFITAEEAIPYIGSHWQGIDLFVLDIRLPGEINGLQLAQKIRDLNCPGYIILTSAYNMPSDTILRTLTAEYYAKPWHLMEITQRLLGYRLPPAVPPANAPVVEVQKTMKGPIPPDPTINVTERVC
jgi:DNA-binding response OmpR family regulator